MLIILKQDLKLLPQERLVVAVYQITMQISMKWFLLIQIPSCQPMMVEYHYQRTL